MFDINYGIIFLNDSSEMTIKLSEKLSELGLLYEKQNVFDEKALKALNEYRISNKLVELDFCDPETLRTLGIDCDGDDIILLASCAEKLAESELEIYNICLEIIKESKEYSISVTEAINRRGVLGKSTPKVSKEAVSAAILAFIHK